jgi:hypothetical protein
VAAGITTKGNCIEPLTREAGIAYAVKVFQAGAIKRHRQQPRKSIRRNRAIATTHTAKETAMGARCPNFLELNGTLQSWEECFEPSD